MDRYNKYQTKQLHAHTYTCTHDSWWLVLGWVTTKEYYRIDFIARYKCNYITLQQHYCIYCFFKIRRLQFCMYFALLASACAFSICAADNHTIYDVYFCRQTNTSKIGLVG